MIAPIIQIFIIPKSHYSLDVSLTIDENGPPWVCSKSKYKCHEDHQHLFLMIFCMIVEFFFSSAVMLKDNYGTIVCASLRRKKKYNNLTHTEKDDCLFIRLKQLNLISACDHSLYGSIDGDFFFSTCNYI